MKERNAVSDLELMEHADGEAPGGPGDAATAGRIARDPQAQAKVASLHQMSELVRGHLELSSDAIPDAKFAAMWRRIDDQLEPARSAGREDGWWSRLASWFDRYRGHVITGAVSAGAVAALALVLRPGGMPDRGIPGPRSSAIDVRPVALRATPEVDMLETPGETSTVINLDDEDGHTTVIWLTPEDTVEGL